jgi:hypothetical protein
METSISERLAFTITSEEKEFLMNFITEFYCMTRDSDSCFLLEKRYSLRLVIGKIEYSIKNNLDNIQLSFDEKLSLTKLLDERFIRIKGKMINISQKKLLRQIINKLNDSILSEFFYSEGEKRKWLE